MFQTPALACRDSKHMADLSPDWSLHAPACNVISQSRFPLVRPGHVHASNFGLRRFGNELRELCEDPSVSAELRPQVNYQSTFDMLRRTGCEAGAISQWEAEEFVYSSGWVKLNVQCVIDFVKTITLSEHYLRSSKWAPDFRFMTFLRHQANPRARMSNFWK